MPHEDSSSELSVTAIATLYQADQNHNISVQNVVMAMLGAGIAYVAATVGFTDQISESVAWWVIELIPLPMWIIGAYHSLLTCSVMRRSVSAQTLERDLIRHAGFSDYRGQVGSYSSDSIMDVKWARWPHVLATAIAYGGCGLIIIGHTIYMLWLASANDANTWETIGFSALYLLLLASVAISWIYGMKPLERDVPSATMEQIRE